MTISELEQFVGQARDDGDEKEPAQDTQPQDRPAHQREYEHSQGGDTQKESSATARVGCGVLLNLVRFQWRASLVGMDGFVLSPVVTEHAADVRDETHQTNISQQKSQPNNSLQ